jgi:hypothetical protein
MSLGMSTGTTGSTVPMAISLWTIEEVKVFVFSFFSNSFDSLCNIPDIKCMQNRNKILVMAE